MSSSRLSRGAAYEDGGTGSDTGNCQNPTAPCESIGYAISQAGNDDATLVTEITYTENIAITGFDLTLQGGYAILGTQWIMGAGETIIDGNDAARTLINYNSHSVLEYLTITGDLSGAGGGKGTRPFVQNRRVVAKNDRPEGDRKGIRYSLESQG